MLTVLLMAVFAMRAPFDGMHQKRLFVIHSQNVGCHSETCVCVVVVNVVVAQITSNERHMHLSAADGAPGFHKLVEDIASEFVKTEETPVPIVMDESNPDWESLYPFSGVRHMTSFHCVLITMVLKKVLDAVQAVAAR